MEYYINCGGRYRVQYLNHIHNKRDVYGLVKALKKALESAYRKPFFSIGVCNNATSSKISEEEFLILKKEFPNRVNFK